ncbi:TIR domain-containing protein [bacterium]|nr:TIR domain-containing protein [bacterium]
MDKLRERGLNIWIDQEGIHGAKLWSQEIVNAIESSKVFILFASTKAFHSKNVTKELALASESDKHILPIFIEDAEIPAAMKYQLAGIQHLVHEQGQTEQTADNILRTLGNLDIQSAEPQPTAAVTPPAATKPASKTPLIAAALVIALAVIAFLLFKGNNTQETSATSATTKTYKSTIDLCVVTISEDGEGSKVSKKNRELRDELFAKLSLFHDYKVIRGEPLSPDATTQEFLDLAKKVNADFILQATIGSDQSRVSAQLFNGRDGSNFWTKSLREEALETDEDFLEESTALIAAHIAGHDGIIHREILQNARVKNEQDLTPIELLQIGKATWENMTKETTLKAIGYLNRCVSLNPDISTAYALLSEIYLEDLRRKYNMTSDPMKKAKDAVRRAIELDSKNAIALIEKLWISWYEKDYTACELQIKLAFEANPYEPLVLVSSASFRVITDRDPELGKQHADLAIKYNETPQGWYYWPLEVYYARNKDYKKALEYILKSNYSDDHGVAEQAILYWLNNEKESALRRYAEVIQINPSYSVKEYNNFTEMQGEKGLESYAYALNEIAEAYENSKK